MICLPWDRIQVLPSQDHCLRLLLPLPAGLSVCLSFDCLHAFSGYGYYRLNTTLFDPGWRGEQTKGPEDSEWGVVDLGNDPIGVADRYVLPFASPCIFLISYLLMLMRLCIHSTCRSVELKKLSLIQPIAPDSILACILHRLQQSLAEGSCGEDCEESLQHMITTHIRARYAVSEVSPNQAPSSITYQHQAIVQLQHRLSTLFQQYMAQKGLERK